MKALIIIVVLSMLALLAGAVVGLIVINVGNVILPPPSLEGGDDARLQIPSLVAWAAGIITAAVVFMLGWNRYGDLADD